MTAPDKYPACEWFALCTNTADGLTQHPILGYVPICFRCAKIAGLTTDEPRGDEQ